jgi:8-oxo-dGTP pyrophosphatase MutT (NUDIX family)/phosphohistidine phosphatase SixA
MASTDRTPDADVVAAGAVVTRRKKGDEPEILLVHRPKYDDWSFPKGKLDRDEHPLAAAVREVAEETGVDIRLGPPLSTQVYEVDNGSRKTKHVHYWVGWVVGCDDVSSYRPNAEIDEVAWFPLAEARARLTYAFDRDTLAEFEAVRKKSYPLLVLRHSKARSRASWQDDDRKRPLSSVGQYQSERLVPLLAAYGVTRVVSSSSDRCWTTVAPYAEVADTEIEVTDALSEEDATPESVAAQVTRIVEGKESAVVCTHRPVLPLVLETLGLAPQPLEPGAILVAHLRKGRVVATEQHEVSDV